MTRRRTLVAALVVAGTLALFLGPSTPVPHHTAPPRSAAIRYADPRMIPPPPPRDQALDRATFAPENPPRRDQPLPDQAPPPAPDRLPTPRAFGERFE